LLKDYLKLWSNNDSFNLLSEGIDTDHSYRALVTGLAGSALVYFMAALAEVRAGKVVVVTADIPTAERICLQLESFLPGQIRFLPPRELFLGGEVLTRSAELQNRRVSFMQWLKGDENGIYVAPVAAFATKALPPERWNNMALTLEVGQKLDRQELLAMLIDRGYERVALTDNRGQFSARGDLVDVFSPALEEPIRIEFFDNLIENLRYYDPETQKTSGQAERVILFPARELILPENAYLAGREKIAASLDRIQSRLQKKGQSEAAQQLLQKVDRHLERLQDPGALDLLSLYLPFIYDQQYSLLDYIPPESLVLMDEPDKVAEKLDLLGKEMLEYNAGSIIDAEFLGSGQDLLIRPEKLAGHIRCPMIACASFLTTGGIIEPDSIVDFTGREVSLYHGQWSLLKNDLNSWHNKGYQTLLVAESEERGRNIKKLLEEDSSCILDHNHNARDNLCYDSAKVIIESGSLEEGFIVDDLQLVLLTENNIVPRKRKKKTMLPAKGKGLSDYRELAVGDYVVHEHHGIGLYQGMHLLEVNGVRRDYLHLKYRGTDKLYLPVDQVGLIQKYSGGAGQAPQLHSLGGGEWRRLRRKVDRSVEKLARELLSLYAARQAVAGHKFGPDHPWQEEFEMNFPFAETADQLRAINDVKADLEKEHPMDRLICGDVGYGKTEVAMRAAFKVIMEGKQVAILVPTTVLAQQHLRTFSERFGSFPFKIAQLSRFLSPAKQKEVIADLAKGKIDLVIGTHRLLSKDISFKDLGLLVIDEEQRFGVRQKEKLKQMRLEVDTLTMTATPIPRTLHLSLAGARDLSIIDTPPENRYPVQTYVIEYSDNLVLEAVQRELKRHGQVYIVYNRVQNIELFTQKLRKLFPQTAIAVGHGQMSGKILEKVMADFQEGFYQVLVSSTIIESGLDIPNVNTLIVYDADHFGLAQLYQIRGRVGRSDRIAYAYLTYRKGKTVSEAARKRLRAIKEFTELGSGFKIALRDLEIRGAGNILGAEQHGFITAVGFDLYVKLLDQAVAVLKNEQREERVNPRLELKVNAYLPSDYISSQAEKVDFYQRLYNAQTLDQVKTLEEELVDRYGTLPEAALSLQKVATIRVLAADLGLEHLEQQKKIVFKFKPGYCDNLLQALENSSLIREKLLVKSENPLILEWHADPQNLNLLDQIIQLLQAMQEVLKALAVAAR
jgi:transcription-repair coupling factor (superfamily II helicase)